MSNSTLSTKSKIQNSQSNVLIEDENLSLQNLQNQKRQIQISKQKLIELVNKNQFLQIVVHLNSKGIQAIQDQKIQLALIYLNEAQKILQYAASSGKNINRSLIISVLHNEACCYQIIWDLQKCSNYIQALIFNLNSQLKYIQNGSNPASQIQVSYLQPAESIKMSLNIINKKTQLAKYYLLFCAINSQLKNNSGALISAKKANTIITQIFKQLRELETIAQLEEKNEQKKMIQQVNNLRENIQTKDLDLLRQAVKYQVKIFRAKTLFAHQSIQNTVKKFKDFSIGDIMRLQPINTTKGNQFSLNNFNLAQQNNESLQNLLSQFSHEKLTQKILILSICCFTIATELRYISNSKINNEMKTSDLYSTQQFKESQIMHLRAIAIVSTFIPFGIIYMDHIITSYTNHYKVTLQSTENQNQHVEAALSQILKYKNIMFITQEQKKCSTTNQSVIVSFQKQDQSIQLQKNMFNEYYYVKGENQSKTNLLMHNNIQNIQKKNNQKKSQTIKTNVKFKDIINTYKCKQNKNKLKKSKSKNKSNSKSLSKTKLKQNKKEDKIIDPVFKPMPSSIFCQSSTACSPNHFQSKASKLKSVHQKSKQQKYKKQKSKTKAHIYGNMTNQYFVFQNTKMKHIKQIKAKKAQKKQNNQSKKERLSKDKKLRKSVSKDTYRSNTSKSGSKIGEFIFRQNKLVNNNVNLHLSKNPRNSQKNYERSSRKTQKSEKNQDIYRNYG